MSGPDLALRLGIDPDAPASDLTAGQLLDALAEVARPPSPYDRLTPAEVWAELRIGRTKYYELVRGNLIRQITDENTGTVFVTRAELDRYKRETGSRRGPISNRSSARARRSGSS